MALDPSFGLTGTAPIYRAKFVDDQTGLEVAPDSVQSLQVFQGGVLQRSFAPPEILNPSQGLYTVQDMVLDEGGILELRWTYVDGGTQRSVSAPFEVVEHVSGAGDKAIADYALAQLGDGVNFIALPAGTVRQCLRQAKIWYAKGHGQTKVADITLVSGTCEYAVADDCYFVIHVSFEGQRTRTTEALGAFGIWGFAQLGMSSIPAEDIFSAGGSNGIYGSLVQSLQYAESGRRILSGEPSWEWRYHTRQLMVFPPPDTTLKATVEYVSTDVDTSNLLPHEEYFLNEYTLAKCKQALGVIRRKYSGYATASGERTMDGDALVMEGNEMVMKLDQELMMYAPAGWIITG
jgi:hypothetical protein